MRGISLAVTLACVMAVSPATAQSLRDIVTDSEGGRVPSQNQWQRRASSDHRGAAPEPSAAEPAPAAPAPSPAASESREPTARTAVCVPPGMPPLSELVAVGYGVMVAPVEGTDDMVAVKAIGLVTKDHLDRYRAGEMPLDFIAYYVRDQLAAIDDHPGDPSQPDLVDTGMVSPRGAALAHGTPLCRWERLTGTPPHPEGAAVQRERI